MSEKETSIYQEVIYLANTQHTQNILERSYLERYKHLFLQYNYTQIKIQKIREIIDKTKEELMELSSRDPKHFYSLIQIRKHLKIEAENDLNKEIKKQEKLELKLNKIISSAPIQNVILRYKEEETEKKFGKYGVDYI